MKRRSFNYYKLAVCLLIFGFSISSHAWATVGGPTRIRILGYDVKSRRVCYAQTSYHGGFSLPRVLFLDLSSGDPRRPHEHSLWDRKLTEKDLPSIDRRISEFEKTLTALRPLEYKRWQLTVENVGHDKMTDPNFGHEIDRFRLRLIFKNQSFTADTVVTAYCNRNVTVFDWYQIPG